VFFQCHLGLFGGEGEGRGSVGEFYGSSSLLGFALVGFMPYGTAVGAVFVLVLLGAVQYFVGGGMALIAPGRLIVVQMVRVCQ
jgi:hypothetical protein